MWVVAALAVVAMLVLPVGQSLAQTPVPSSPYDPANCTTERISTDDMAMVVATPAPESLLGLSVSENGVAELPGGTPATADELAVVTATIDQLWACNNARDKAAVFALFTDEAIQDTVGASGGASWDAADLRANVAAELTPGDPRAAEDWASVDAIVSATTYDDGQIGVLILNTDPLVADGDQVLDYFRFTMVDGVAIVSGVLLDPYDLTPDYGFEKMS